MNIPKATRLAVLAAAMLSVTCSTGGGDPLAVYAEDSGELDHAGASLQSHSTLLAYYDSYHGASYEICLVNYLTAEPIALPNLEGYDPEHASLAAGGRYLAYDAMRYDPYGQLDRDVKLYDRETASVVALPGLNREGPADEEGNDDIDPSIAGSGRFIAFSSNRRGLVDIFLYDRAIARLVRLPGLNSSAIDAQPSISSDGRYIAFSSNRTGASKIYLYDRSVGALIATPGLQDNPGWERYSPDLNGNARFIVFGQNRVASPNPNIALYDRTTRSFVSIPGVNGPTSENRPSLSHDARYLAFERNPRWAEEDRDDHPEILIYDRTASSILRVISEDVCGTDQRGPSMQNQRPMPREVPLH